MKLDSGKLGLLFGLFYGLWHLVWALLVAAGVAKPLLDGVLWLHFLSLDYTIEPFSVGRAALLVVIASVCGYGLGSVLGETWNVMKDKSCSIQK